MDGITRKSNYTLKGQSSLSSTLSNVIFDKTESELLQENELVILKDQLAKCQSENK
jgi:hypothetical protein